MKQSEDFAFLLMPFDTRLRWLHQRLVEAGSRAGIRVERADDIAEAGVIIDQVKDRIRSAKAIIAVVTGRNANVFYELGIAETLHVPIIVAEDATDLPFDIRHFRTAFYGRPGTETRRTLAARVGHALIETMQAREQPLPEITPASKEVEVPDPPQFGWLPRHDYSLVPPEASALIVRCAIATANPASAFQGFRTTQELRSSLAKKLQQSRTTEWLVGQSDAWSLTRQREWVPVGPSNTSRDIRLLWEAQRAELKIASQLVLLATAGLSPVRGPAYLIDVAIAESDSDIHQDPTPPLLLGRFAALLDAAVATCMIDIVAGLARYVPAELEFLPTLCHVSSWRGAITEYVDFGEHQTVPGNNSSHGGSFAFPRDRDPTNEADRRSQVVDWIEEMALDSGILDARAVVQSL